MSLPDSVTKFGEKLRLLRNHHGLTLAQLSHIFGYQTHSYLSEIESGRKPPTITLVLKVSRLFAVSADELLKDEINIDVGRSTLNIAPQHKS